MNFGRQPDEFSSTEWESSPVVRTAIMSILAEIIAFFVVFIVQVLIELLGYLIWWTLELVGAGANATGIGVVIGIVASICLFGYLQSTILAGLVSTLVMVLSIGLGVLIDSASGTK